jgi:hypothetical protein
MYLELLDPELTLGTLLELMPLNEINEYLIIPVELVGNLVLLAGLVDMEINSATHTVLLIALGAVEVCISLREEKRIGAIGCGAPGYL